MAVNKYRLKDVPKGKRLQHFFAYYKLHLFYAIAFAILIGYTLYAFWKPDPDIQVIWMSDKYTMECEQELRSNCEALDWDTNGDGTVAMILTYVDFNAPYEEVGYDLKTEVTTYIAALDYSFFLVNDYAYEWMEECDLLGTYGETGLEHWGAEEELVRIPVSQIDFLQGPASEPLQGLYLCVSAPPEQSETRAREYEKQMTALRRALGE